MLDVREMVRRFKLGQSNHQVAHELGANRRTVIKYRKLAHRHGWIARPDLPTPGEIESQIALVTGPPPPFGPESTVEPHRERVAALRAKGVELMALWQILRDEHGYTGSYSSIRRFVGRLEPKTPEACVRVETAPGEEAQVDFGYAGLLVDPATGELRRAWVFVMTLGYSRHQYAQAG